MAIGFSTNNIEIKESKNEIIYKNKITKRC